jgi:hypothetical protein
MPPPPPRPPKSPPLPPPPLLPSPLSMTQRVWIANSHPLFLEGASRATCHRGLHFNSDSESELAECKRRGREIIYNNALQNFEEWPGQDQVTDGRPAHFMRWHLMLNETRSKRTGTDAPSETVATAAAAAAAAADTSAVADAAAAAAASATFFWRALHDLSIKKHHNPSRQSTQLILRSESQVCFEISRLKRTTDTRARAAQVPRDKER